MRLGSRTWIMCWRPFLGFGSIRIATTTHMENGRSQSALSETYHRLATRPSRRKNDCQSDPELVKNLDNTHHGALRPALECNRLFASTMRYNRTAETHNKQL